MSERVDATRYATVFHAAARGVMAPFREGYDHDAFVRAQSIAGAFQAVGDMFAKIAEAELIPPPEDTP